MLRLFVQWRLVFVAALALMTIASQNVGVQAQEVGAVATPSSEVTAAAIVANVSASTAPPATVAPAQATEPVPVTKAPTVPSTPEVAKAATTPVVTEAVKTTTTPASSPRLLKMLSNRNRRSEDPNLGTPVALDTSTTTFPAASMPSIVAPTARELSAWKATGSTFTSRDLPLSANARAKLNAITRLSTEYDMTNQQSHVTGLSVHGSLTQAPQALQETRGSFEQSFSIRGYSELSIHHANDLETDIPVLTHERDSASDGYSSGDRYSASGKYSASSRLSSDPGRSSSGWSQLQASKNPDIHRYSSTSSTSSSIVARNLNPVSSSNQDHPSGTNIPNTKDSTSMRTSRIDVPNWYSVIESPTDIGRYTASSLESDTISNAHESYEL
ncbi:unnamed protein product [Peronospora destructor]|uniref:Uncharacterized protein n=1 Tax=Peronospora destructor TaxID=86335 RepID=A0AAV0T5D6_9STRA|nr:unnamed protein product [Peronospora destructor]